MAGLLLEFCVYNEHEMDVAVALCVMRECPCPCGEGPALCPWQAWQAWEAHGRESSGASGLSLRAAPLTAASHSEFPFPFGSVFFYFLTSSNTL